METRSPDEDVASEFITEGDRRLLKEPVIAFAINYNTQGNYEGGTENVFFEVTPIILPYPAGEGGSEDTKINGGDHVEIVPAPERCFLVWGQEEPGSDNYVRLGCEYPGANPIDWDEIAESGKTGVIDWPDSVTSQ